MVGLEVLGYPPTWSFPSMKQVMTLEEALKGGTHESLGNAR